MSQKLIVAILLLLFLVTESGPARAAGAGVGPFSCDASVHDGAIEATIRLGTEQIILSPPEGSWDPQALICEPWQDEAVRVTIPGDGGRAWEAFVYVGNDGMLSTGWTGVTGLGGDWGDRWGWFLDWEPVQGGASRLPILYVLHERAEICGRGMVPIFPHAWDPGSGAFRPVQFDRLKRDGGWGAGLVPASGVSTGKPTKLVTAYPSTVPRPGEPALLDQLEFRFASSLLGDGGNPDHLSAPLVLADGDPASGWVEGTGGHGWGEFVTARVKHDAIPITRLVVWPTRGDGDPKQWNRIRSFTIVASGGQIFEVKIPKDPAKKPGAPVVLEFPEPLQTECLSLVVHDVYAAGKKWGDHTYIGEIEAHTVLEDTEGLMEVFGWFDDAEFAATASLAVEDLGPSAIPRIETIWDAIPDGARRSVVDSMRPEWIPVIEPLLDRISREIFEQEDHQLFVRLVEGLEVLLLTDESGPLVDFLHGWLTEPGDVYRTTVAAASLAHAGDPDALFSLLFAYLAPGTVQDMPWIPWNEGLLESWLRTGIARGGDEGLQIVSDVLDMTEGITGESLRRILVILYLLDWEEAGDRTLELASSWLTRLWTEVPTLYCRHHLVPIAGALVDRGVRQAALVMASSLEDAPPGLVIEAFDVLARSRGQFPEIVEPAALAGLEDEDPGVRAAAARCVDMQESCGEKVQQKLVVTALVDPWPEVRLAALRAVSNFDSIPDEAVWSFMEDPSSSVRKQAIRLVVERGMATEEIGILLANTAYDRGMRADVRVDAAHAVGKLCILSMAEPLANILYYGTVPDAQEGDILAAAAAAWSLGRLGNGDVVENLIEATRPGLRLEIRLACIDSLGLLADPEAREVMEYLSKSPDPFVAEAASMALGRLQAGVELSACGG